MLARPFSDLLKRALRARPFSDLLNRALLARPFSDLSKSALLARHISHFLNFVLLFLLQWLQYLCSGMTDEESADEAGNEPDLESADEATLALSLFEFDICDMAGFFID